MSRKKNMNIEEKKRKIVCGKEGDLYKFVKGRFPQTNVKFRLTKRP